MMFAAACSTDRSHGDGPGAMQSAPPGPSVKGFADGRRGEVLGRQGGPWSHVTARGRVAPSIFLSAPASRHCSPASPGGAGVAPSEGPASTGSRRNIPRAGRSALRSSQAGPGGNLCGRGLA